MTSPLLRTRVAPFTFIDLFAGIGGTRLGFELLGGECVFTSEWDRFAQKTYEANFGERPFGDIRVIDPSSIPDHDVLVAGFPCQPFSLAGVSKLRSLGRQHGFENPEQGNLFFHVAEILDVKRPRAFLLENVKNLQSHDRGRTFATIRETLEETLGYHVSHQVIDAAAVVPQHRERIYIVGFRSPEDRLRFEFPELEPSAQPLSELLDDGVPERYTLSDHLWSYLREYAKKHRERGNGFGYGIPPTEGPTRTLSARYHKDGSEILIPQGEGNPRRLTPRECARLMGFPESYIIDAVSDTQAYRQFGNSVVVPVIEAIGRAMLRAMCITPSRKTSLRTWKPHESVQRRFNLEIRERSEPYVAAS